jgi:hypothetical protein
MANIFQTSNTHHFTNSHHNPTQNLINQNVVNHNHQNHQNDVFHQNTHPVGQSNPGCTWNGAGHACIDNINGSIVGGATAGGVVGGATGGGILPGIAIGGVTGGIEHCVANVANYLGGC